MAEITRTVVEHVIATKSSVDGISSLWLTLIPLIGVVTGFVVTYFTAARTVYVNSITAERSKWLEKLRQNIATYIEICHKFSDEVTREPPDKTVTDKLSYDIVRVAATLRLQLNPDAILDSDMLNIISMLPVFAEHNPEKFLDVHVILINQSQFLLKNEWERVKMEAGGWFYRFRHRNDARRRKERYFEFRKDREILQTLIKEGVELAGSLNRSATTPEG